MKAAQIIEPDKPLKLNQVDISDPTGTQVLLKVISTGVCHSDLHLWEGGYDTGDGFMKVTDRGVKFPVTPGHEVVGTIEKIGDSVKDVKIGDNVQNIVVPLNFPPSTGPLLGQKLISFVIYLAFADLVSIL